MLVGETLRMLELNLTFARCQRMTIRLFVRRMNYQRSRNFNALRASGAAI
jgi:hypothetical protein